ncbi:MAG: hypothetical protein U1E73_09600 [Planctomycetota bacterium]
MANVLKPEKQGQVRALGRLGWSVRQIHRETGVDRASIRRYLTETGIVLRKPRRRRLPGLVSKPASQVTTDPGLDPKPASQVTTDPVAAAAWDAVAKLSGLRMDLAPRTTR